MPSLPPPRTLFLPLSRATSPLTRAVLQAATSQPPSPSLSPLTLRVVLAPDAPHADLVLVRDLRHRFPHLLPERGDVTADLQRAGDVARVMDGCDTLLLAGGELEAELALLDAAHALGLRRVLKLSCSAGLLDERSVHWRVEQQLRASFKGEAQVLRSSTGMDAFLRGRLREMVCGRTLSVSVRRGRVAFVHPRDVAEVVVRLAVGGGDGAADDAKGSSSEIRELALTGPEALTYEQVARTFSQHLGEQVRYSFFPLWAVQTSLWIKGVRADEIVSEIALARALEAGVEEQVTDTVSEVLGRPPRTFDEFVRENASQWPLQSHT